MEVSHSSTNKRGAVRTQLMQSQGQECLQKEKARHGPARMAQRWEEGAPRRWEEQKAGPGDKKT